ncbi:tripartite tricarboxylate transporter substrate-binding protein [Siccirubricoccus deserti]
MPALAQPRGIARIIVGFPPGGSADTTARLMAERLRGSYAQNVIVENRVGAAGRMAVEAVRAAEPDGDTILLTAASMLVIFPHMYSRATLRYDPFTDLLPVTPAGESPSAWGSGRRPAASARCGSSSPGAVAGQRFPMAAPPPAACCISLACNWPRRPGCR